MYFVFAKEVIIKIMVDCKVTVLYKFHFLIILTEIKKFVVHIIYLAVKTSAKYEEDYPKI